MSFPCPHCDVLIDAPSESPLESCRVCAGPLLVAGQYLLTGLFGRGGIGSVYAAIRRSDGQKVAVKSLSLADIGDWKVRDLFEHGAQVLRSLSHPSLPKVYA